MCRVKDSGKAVDGFFVLGASERLFKASIIAMLCLVLKRLLGLASLRCFGKMLQRGDKLLPEFRLVRRTE